MNTRIRGKVIAQVAGAGLIAASTVGAAALAVDTYQDINQQKTQSAAATAPVTQNSATASATPVAEATTSAAATDTTATNTSEVTGATDTSTTDTTTTDTSTTDTSATDISGTTTDTGAATTYVQAPPAGAGSQGASSGS